MRKHRTILVFAACALVLLIMGMISVNCVQKLSHGCPISQNMKLKAHPCLRETVTSFGETNAVVLPASGVVLPEPSPVFHAQGLETLNATTNLSLETPPLRC